MNVKLELGKHESNHFADAGNFYVPFSFDSLDILRLWEEIRRPRVFLG